MKILITDCATLNSNNDLPLNLLQKYGNLVCNSETSREELLESVRDVDIILCNKTVIDSAVMAAAPRLKYIGLFATGYNNIDIQEAHKRGITVCNAGSYSTNAVTQQTFAYILEHYNNVEKYNNLVKKGGWQNASTFAMFSYPTGELMGKTIGIIGYGSIGKKVAEIALAFEMRVLVFTRTPKEDERVLFVSLEQLLENSDIVTAHCPLNEQSRQMFNNETFEKMKDGAFFINTARGGIVNEKALFDALTSGKLSGAAIDVLEQEPMSKDCILMDAPNLIITPHTAWAAVETRRRLLSIVDANIQAFLDKNPQNVI